MRRAAIAAIAVAAVLSSTAGAAEPATECELGGPSGTFRAFRVDLPAGSDHLKLELTASRSPRPVADASSWHLAQGIFVVYAQTGQLVAHRISSEGSSPRRVVVDAGAGDRVEADAPGPDVPFVHSDQRLRPGLEPGSYVVVAFGSDGDPSFPNDAWGARFGAAGDHTCSPIGTGEVFDYDPSDFRGGTNVTAGPAAHLDGATLSAVTARKLTVGLMDASTQVAGDARLDYSTPTGTGSVEDAIVPFASGAGAYSWASHFTSPAATLAIAGVRLDLP